MTTATLEYIAYNGHAIECLCERCCMADMNAHIAKMGWALTAENDGEDITPERTRYATPGQSCGAGVVRYVSEAQVRYILRLMEERDTTNLVRLPGSENVEKMSLRGARDLIERLLDCPKKPDAGLRPATEKQITFCLSLIERKGVKDITEEHVRAAGAEAVSKMINLLLEMSDSAVAAPETSTSAPIDAGMYRAKDGAIYKIQRSRESGRLYGKRLDLEAGKFVYAPGAMRAITGDDRMTLEEAKLIGQETGICCWCAAELTNPESIERGIGPVCARKLGA